MPYEIVRRFEQALAAYAGARYAVAVESCSAALLLSCLWANVRGHEVTIPARTYPSVPCSILLAGGRVKFSQATWAGSYRLEPYSIWDSALRFKRGMYQGEGLVCLSFHIRKHLPIGRGGAILTDNADEAAWLRLARFDGREECDLSRQRDFKVIGLNAYMTPEQAARGLMLLSLVKDRDLEDLKVEDQYYPDLSLSPVYGGQ